MTARIQGNTPITASTHTNSMIMTKHNPVKVVVRYLKKMAMFSCAQAVRIMACVKCVKIRVCMVTTEEILNVQHMQNTLISGLDCV